MPDDKLSLMQRGARLLGTQVHFVDDLPSIFDLEQWPLGKCRVVNNVVYMTKETCRKLITDPKYADTFTTSEPASTRSKITKEEFDRMYFNVPSNVELRERRRRPRFPR